MKITSHLPTTTPASLETATTHPFLRLAGLGRISTPLLAQWLSQDRLYAQSYVRFIGLLLAKVHLPAIPSSSSSSSTVRVRGAGEQYGKVQEKILDILIDALTNIRTELGFFEDVAREYQLDLNTPFPTSASSEEGGFSPAPITQSYIDMFMSAGSPGTSLLEGLVVLWATEICYLTAWRYAASFLDTKSTSGDPDVDSGALREKFIPNWSSEEFEGFVERIGMVLDELAEVEGVTERKEILGRCERWWRQVVWLEERFWPEVQESGKGN